MAGALVNRLEAGYPDEPGDCAICALAAYLGHPYTDVLRVVTTSVRAQGKRGLWRQAMVRVAARLGHTLRKRRITEDAYGIIVAPEHAAVVRNGLVLDRVAVWELDDWCRHQGIELDDCDFYTAVD